MSKENQVDFDYLTEASKEIFKPVWGLGRSALRTVTKNISRRLTRIGGRASSGIKKEFVEKILR